MKRALLLGFFLSFFGAALALAALKFPALTGRVVDEAHVLKPATIEAIDQKLEAYENGTQTQFVVATLSSLQGDDIADYGYQLGRAWGIGQKGKDNGVLLIVAPNQKKVRIEVGYGHEGTLTDALSSQIINQTILPRFKQGDIDGGVAAGVDAIIATLGGEAQAAPAATNGDGEISNTEVIIILILVVIFCVRYPMLAWFIFSTSSSGSYRGGGGSGWSSGGGFSGGGGSFGGGGASGSW
jgi:uncharacterized protein